MQPSGNLQIGLFTEPGHDRGLGSVAHNRFLTVKGGGRNLVEHRMYMQIQQNFDIAISDPLIHFPGGTIVFCRIFRLCLGETTFSLDCSRFRDT